MLGCVRYLIKLSLFFYFTWGRFGFARPASSAAAALQKPTTPAELRGLASSRRLVLLSSGVCSVGDSITRVYFYYWGLSLSPKILPLL